jgi:hypothetical protein
MPGMGTRLLGLLLGFSVVTGVQAQWQLEYRGLVTENHFNTASTLSMPPAYLPVPQLVYEHDAVITYQRRGLRMQSSLYAVEEDGAGYGTEALVNELFYDFSAAGLEWSLGKKVVPWGVGYGLRPLDVVQQEQRLVDQPRELEGVPLLAVESFSETTTRSVVLFEREDGAQTERALAFKYYRLLEGKDLFAVARMTEHGNHAAGMGVSAVVGEQLEWHASALYLSRYEKFIRAAGAPLLASTDPFQLQEYRDGLQYLLGATWSWANGVSLLAEAWHDDSAYNATQWQQLMETVAQQRDLLGSAPADAVYNNLLWDLRAYQAVSLMQDNMLLRISYEGERLDPSLVLLWSPADGGLVSIFDASYGWGNHGSLFASLRMLGGKAGSVYAESPIDRLWILGVRFNGIL